ncbi:MAG TPA: putative baseplate assembly protein, partial [Thermoanaerobaculia bacterium]|nr:putative baseplate assembly protein [Thermoanaerobaculia bacterium]
MSEPCQHGCTCGCCEGVEALTPLDTANRPGLDALRYRVGTHSAFLETMKARLSSQGHPELAGLTTREASDPSIALLDAWATAADVLTFYQERIANEGYLRTATERRSVRELARLIGYELRPGVAASTWLAFTLDPGPEVVIPAGARAQSVPGPGELPQPFETSADLVARAAWNQLPVRLTRPQLGQDARRDGALYLKGISTQLKVNDPLLIRTAAGAKPVLHRVKSVEPDAKAERTRVTFESWLPLREILQTIYEVFSNRGKALGDAKVDQAYADLEDLLSLDTEPELRQELKTKFLPELRETRDGLPVGPVKLWFDDLIDELEMAAPAPPDPVEPQITDISKVLDSLAKSPSVPPASPARLSRAPGKAFDAGSDSSARLLLATRPELRKVYYKAWANVPVAKPPVLEVWAPRLRASAFGHNAPLPLKPSGNGFIPDPKDWPLDSQEQEKVVVLDTSYPQILPGSWIALERPTAIDGSRLVITTVEQVAERSRAAYGISGKATHATLRDRWLNLSAIINESEAPTTLPGDDFQVIRGTAIFANSEPLELAETPIREALCKGDLELAGLFDGLEPGRWLIVAGERADVVATEKETGTDKREDAATKIPVPGVPAAELVMVAEVRQGAEARAGESTHTTLVLASELAYCYRRDTVVVWGNVAPATHGETKSEILGSGRGSEPLQRFTLKQGPLTQVSAPT